MKKNSFIVAAAMTGIIGASMIGSTIAFAGDAPQVKCVGNNACKGTGACKTAANDCATKNSCKGAGWTKTSKKECQAAMKKDKKVKMEDIKG